VRRRNSSFPLAAWCCGKVRCKAAASSAITVTMWRRWRRKLLVEAERL
jgi:hypothetical protein